MDLGVIYLLEGTQLNVTLLDRTTGRPIGPYVAWNIFACEQRTGVCPFGVQKGGGTNVSVWAAPGPTVLHVNPIGYVVNVSSIGTIPSEPVGTTVPRTVYLTPMGAVELNISVTGGMPTVGGTTIALYDPWWVTVVRPPQGNTSGMGVCSLSGIEVGVVNPAGGIEPSPCFPFQLVQFGTTSILVGPPLRVYIDLGSFQGISPFFRNETWANLTPDRLTDAGYLNFTPGAYISGHVYLGLGETAPTTYTVQACSTDESSICGPAVTYGTYPNTKYVLDQSNATRLHCPNDTGAFCVGAPPGPVEIEAWGSNATASNWTWAEVPFRCCTAVPHTLFLGNISPTTSIRLPTGSGEVYGRVASGGGPVALPLDVAEVTVCPVAYSSTVSCEPSVATTNGSFTAPAPFGWDSVRASADSYDDNTTWVDVTGVNDTGTIYLAADALVTGYVVDPEGQGVIGAQVTYCPVGATSVVEQSCAPVGKSPTGSGGYYWGGVPGAPFPGATYLLEASAGGYLANWTWVNASSGEPVRAPTVVLAPVGSVPARAPARALGPVPTPGTWVAGRIVDGATGAGIPDVDLYACTVAGSHPCTTFSDSTSTGGEFNQSLAVGAYWLNASAPGYLSTTFYLNATGTAPVQMGALDLPPLPWVAGRVVIAPWVSYSLANGFGPGDALVTVCTGAGTLCGPTVPLNTAGFFNTSAPIGNYDRLTVNATGGSPYDSGTQIQAQGAGPGGYLDNVTPVNVTSSGVVLPGSAGGALRLLLFGTLLGSAGDASTWNASTHQPAAPARWGVLQSNGPLPGDRLSVLLSGGGRFALFVAGPANLTLTVGGSAYRTVNNTTSRAPASAATTTSVSPFDLPHYGWVRATIASVSGSPIPFASVNATVADPGNRTTLSTSGTANGVGVVNLSAPPGTNVSFGASATGYSPSTTSGAVLPSRTSPIEFAGLVPLPSSDLYARSEEVNDVGVAPFPTVVDSLSHAPITGATVLLENGTFGFLEGFARTNGLGQFLVSGPISPTLGLEFLRDGYASLLVGATAPASGTYVQPEVDLVGDGILAGRVVAAPGSTGVAGADVMACEFANSAACENATTNGNGTFWLGLPPGRYEISVGAVDYVANVTLAANVSSDVWTWAGTVPVYANPLVSGTVVGRPFYLPIVGANVTICPVNGTFSIYCAFPTPTDLTGSFSLAVVPGLYWVRVVASGYGPWSLEIELVPGGSIRLGTIALDANGEILGYVESATTGAPIDGASVLACPTGPSPCEGPVPTDATGFYLLSNVTPGGEVVQASAVGYSLGHAGVDVPGGEAALAPVIDLWPVGSIATYAVRGTV
ncbi:MAG TPA: carboxypeptidase-like regulatory domain-containing protein, partial [Thermoplasmata archaeon]|nr:carboxypeptidase-like regulatory domain-containing protein [Thermoplasmata archaeon]